MEWAARIPTKLFEGDIRIVRKFLLLPKCIDGKWRWLEYAEFAQRVCRMTASDPGGGRFTYLCWADIRWLSRD